MSNFFFSFIIEGDFRLFIFFRERDVFPLLISGTLFLRAAFLGGNNLYRIFCFKIVSARGFFLLQRREISLFLFSDAIGDSAR